MDNNIKWWQKAIGYQIYPKTFFDANGDGHGDLLGIVKKLDYLKMLGVDFLWICPFFKSPMDDNGYDISDFCDVHDKFGSLQDFKLLIAESKKRDMRILVDLVLNHTSDEHHWFVDVKTNPLSSYRDYYYITENKNGKPVNNWGSFFGGSVWEPLNENEYYMHIFSEKMPDLNWSNAKVRNEMFKIAKWWLDLGVDGFRVDAVSHLSKSDLNSESDLPTSNGIAYDWSKFSNLPLVHDYLKEFNREVLNKYDAFAVGEVGGGAKISDALKFCGHDRNELHMTFTFDHIWCNNIDSARSNQELKLNVKQLKKTLEYWQTDLFGKAWYPLYFNNHDFNRVASNYGHYQFHQKSCQCLATTMYLLWGTPFIYQGEEIGMTNYPFEKIDDYEDVSAIGQYNAKPESEKAAFLEKLKLMTRDNARTTMQWNDSKYGGFSTKQIPGIKTNPNYVDINVENQLKDPNSILNYYKKVLALKKTNETFIFGKVKFIDLESEDLISYLRYDDCKCYLVVCNLSENQFEVPLEIKVCNVILSNSKVNIVENKISFSAFSAFVFEVEGGIVDDFRD